MARESPDGDEVSQPLIAGLPERFRVEAEIGRGGMSVVYRALDTQLDRFVAIKVLSEESSGAVDLERFEREIAVMARLVHPSIVSLFDSGVADGRLFYVMPFVPGESLRSRLVRDRRLTLEEAAAIAADVADALAFAHAGNVVHRDVKPENVLLVGGRALLADFGIAHVVSKARAGSGAPSAPALTADGTLLGTLQYISPEQDSGGGPVDGRSDLYSLGCLLYESLTGVPPFTGSAVALIGQHLSATPRPLADHGIRVSAPIASLVDRLLEKSPEARPSGAADVAKVLRSPQSLEGNAPAVSAAEADRLVADGRDAFRIGTAGGPSSRQHMDQAGVYYRRALAVAPRHALALVLLGNWHYVMARLGFAPRAESHAKGRELAFAALEADDRVAEVHASFAKVTLYYEDNVHAAERHAKRSVALGPDDPEALRTYSVILKMQGRLDEAIAVARTAVAAGPQYINTLSALADALLQARQPDEAIETLKRSIRMLPGHVSSLERLERAHVQKGDAETALDFRVSRLLQTGAGDRAREVRQDAEAFGAHEARARDIRREIESLSRQATEKEPFAEPFTSNSIGDRLALAYSDVGDWENAVAWIERAFTDRPERLQRLLMDLPFDFPGLATQRAFVRLLRVSGLEELVLR